MPHVLVAAVLAGLLLVSSPLPAESLGGEVLYRDVKRLGQKENLWCWATAVEMIAGVPQCEQAQTLNTSDVDCCQPKSSNEGDFYENCVGGGGWPDLQLLEGFASTEEACRKAAKLDDEGDDEGDDETYVEDCHLKWKPLKKALQLKPVAFAWRYGRSGGHMMVASGYLEGPAPGERWVLVNDPWPPHAGDVMLITYERFKTGSDGQHWRDYYMKKRQSQTKKKTKPVRYRFDPESTPAVGPAPKTGERAGEGICRVSEVPSEAASEARRGIRVLRALTESGPEASAMARKLRLEFENGGPMELGKPLAVATLTLDTLKQPSVDLDTELRDRNQYVFPINIETEHGLVPISSVSVVRKDGEWGIATVGRQHLVSTLFGSWLRSKIAPVASGEMEKLEELEAEAGQSHFLVDVPALYDLYLATCKNDVPTFTSVFAKLIPGEHEDRRMEAEFGKLFVSMLLDHLGDEAFTDYLDAMEFPAGGPTREQHAEELRSLVASIKGVESFEDLKKKLARKARNYVSPLAGP